MLRRFVSVLALCLAPVAGCGGQKSAEVTGTVTHKEKPLAQGTITFFSERGPAAFGKIRGGKIVEVTTRSLNDGAAPGNYKVAISSVSNPDDMYAEHVSLISEKYNSPDNSGLTAQLKPGANELTFTLD
jgi:hypothetical protein